MKSLRFLFWAMAVFWAVRTLPAQTLEQTVHLALQQNKTILARKQAVRKAQLEAKAAFRYTLPRLDFNASYRHVTHVPHIQFPAFLGSGTGINLGAYDSYETGLTLRYALFNGFANRNTVRLREQRAALSQIVLQQTQKEVAFQTISAYRQVQRWLLERDVLKNSMARTDLQLARIRALIGQGMALALDSLSLTLAKLRLQKQMIEVQNHLQTAQAQLDQLTGQKVTVQAFGGEEVTACKVRPLFAQMETLKKLEQQSRMQQTQIRLKQAAYFPGVQIFAGYNYGKPGADMIRNEWMSYGVWGVNVSWNIFNWFSDRLQVQAARAEAEEIRWQKQTAKEESQTRFESALRTWQTLFEQYKVLKTAFDVAGRKMKIVEARYRQGMATVTDFNRANLDLTEAELNVKRQLLLLALQRNQVEFLSGEPINQWSIRK